MKLFRKSMMTSLASSSAAVAAPITAYRTPWCGCCHAWAEAVRQAGPEMRSVEIEDLSKVRRDAGVPADMEDCHTAIVDGYFLEGHVPLEAIAKLLGMGNDPAARYAVHAVPRDPAAAPSVFYRAAG